MPWKCLGVMDKLEINWKTVRDINKKDCPHRFLPTLRILWMILWIATCSSLVCLYKDFSLSPSFSHPFLPAPHFTLTTAVPRVSIQLLQSSSCRQPWCWSLKLWRFQALLLHFLEDIESKPVEKCWNLFQPLLFSVLAVKLTGSSVESFTVVVSPKLSLYQQSIMIALY